MRNIFILLCVIIIGCTSKPKQRAGAVVKATTYDSVSTHNSNHTDLSNEFDVHVNFRRYFFKRTNREDSCIAELLLQDKHSKATLDTISITSRFYPDDAFINPANVRSWSTKTNTRKQAIDNYYGDIIIADLNFDNKDDVIVINDAGGNGGAFYSYYLQNNNKKFILNSYLTDSMTYFPSKINSSNKTLTTYVHAGVCGPGEHIYKFSVLNKYTQISHKIIDVCK
ncbi:MAG TPA: hypothetical protein VIM79_12995 [Niastella sp.]